MALIQKTLIQVMIWSDRIWRDLGLIYFEGRRRCTFPLVPVCGIVFLQPCSPSAFQLLPPLPTSPKKTPPSCFKVMCGAPRRPKTTTFCCLNVT
jgi:hypothetical protein